MTTGPEHTRPDTIEGGGPAGEELFRAFVRQTRDGIVIVDGDGAILEWNEGQESISGIARSEALSRPIWEVQRRLAPEGQRTDEYARVAREKALKGLGEGGGLRRVLEEEIQRPDGGRRIVQSVLFGLPSGGQMLAGAICRDVTESRRLEDELRANEERLSLALAASGQGLWDWDIVADTAYLSPEYLQLIGGGESEIPSARAFFQGTVHPDDARAVAVEMETHLQGKTPRSVIEYRMRRRSGEYCWVRGVGQVTARDPHGAPLRMTGVIGDIGDRRRMEEALRAAVRSRDDLLAVVSHDLRNPLSVIEMTLDLLRQGGAEGEGSSRADPLGVMIRSAGRMRRLIDDLLQAAAIDSGTFTLEKAREEVLPIIVESVQALSPLAAAKTLRLEQEVPSSIPAIDCDRQRVLQVLSNLLGNAVKFVPGGGLICVRTAVLQEHVEISVSDSGPGISEDLLPHVFERYWKGKTEGRRGVGLGLFIAKSIVEAHGGRIRAESRVGIGSTFFFTIPIA